MDFSDYDKQTRLKESQMSKHSSSQYLCDVIVQDSKLKSFT